MRSSKACSARSRRPRAERRRARVAATMRPLRWSPADLENQAVEVARIVGQQFTPAVGDDDGVGMTETADLVVVERGLDREHHPGLERGRVTDVQERRLVVSEAGPMTGVLPPIPL